MLAALIMWEDDWAWHYAYSTWSHLLAANASYLMGFWLLLLWVHKHWCRYWIKCLQISQKWSANLPMRIATGTGERTICHVSQLCSHQCMCPSTMRPRGVVERKDATSVVIATPWMLATEFPLIWLHPFRDHNTCKSSQDTCICNLYPSIYTLSTPQVTPVGYTNHTSQKSGHPYQTCQVTHAFAPNHILTHQRCMLFFTHLS